MVNYYSDIHCLKDTNSSFIALVKFILVFFITYFRQMGIFHEQAFQLCCFSSSVDSVCHCSVQSDFSRI